MCATARDPKRPVWVIDTFYGYHDGTFRKSKPGELYDLNKDNRLDKVFHGDMVSPYLKKEGLHVQPYPCDPGRQEVIACLVHAARRVEENANNSNFVKPSFINLSYSNEIPFERLEELSGVKGITPQNIASHREEILKGLRERLDQYNKLAEPVLPRVSPFKPEPSELNEIKDILNVSEAISKLAQHGVPVVVAIANTGPESPFFNFMINANALSPEAIGVGALDESGHKANYSADNSLITYWRRGTYPLRKVKGGYNITDTPGRIDIPAEQISKGKSLEGAPVQGNVTEIPPAAWAEARELHKKYWNTRIGFAMIPSNILKEFAQKHLSTAALYKESDLIRLSGGNVGQNQNSPEYYFNALTGNRFVDDGTGHLKSTVPANIVFGTSLATPSICSQPRKQSPSKRP